MNSVFSFLLEGETAATANNGTSTWMTIGMLVLVVVVFYFFLIRPQKKQEKEAANMRNSLQVGDEIVTIGGIVGQIISVKGETITIATSKDRTKLRFLKTAVREVTVRAGEEEEETKPAPKAAVEPAREKADDKPKKSKKAKSEATDAPAEEPAEAPVQEADAPVDEAQGE